MLFVTHGLRRSAAVIVAALFAVALFASALLGSGVANAASGYTEVAQPEPTEGQVVVEYFWYGCPHCNALQAHIPTWKARLPAEVRFQAVPVALRPEWVDHARAFYAAQRLGVLEPFHPALFKALHEEKRRLQDAASLAAFAAETTGVAAQAFVSAMASDAVETQIFADMDRIKRLGLKATPTLVVNGRYRITPDSAGGYAEMLEVVDRLLANAAQRQ